MNPRTPVWTTALGGAVLDALLIIVFAAIGRSTHETASPVTGALGTAWPFLVGAGIGWLVVRALRKDWPLGVGPGITVWFATVVIGMTLRQVTGAGTALPFVLVAAGTLAAFLIGWRAVAAGLNRRRGTAT